MKILFDEDVPLSLGDFIGSEHEVVHVRDMSWNEDKKERLHLIIDEDYDMFVTGNPHFTNRRNIKLIPFTIAIPYTVNHIQKTYIKLAPKLFVVLTRQA